MAKELIRNAIDYGKSGDLTTVMVNLEEIAELLDAPARDNDDYDWEDFK